MKNTMNLIKGQILPVRIKAISDCVKVFPRNHAPDGYKFMITIQDPTDHSKECNCEYVHDRNERPRDFTVGIVQYIKVAFVTTKGVEISVPTEYEVSEVGNRISDLRKANPTQVPEPPKIVVPDNIYSLQLGNTNIGMCMNIAKDLVLAYINTQPQTDWAIEDLADKVTEIAFAMADKVGERVSF